MRKGAIAKWRGRGGREGGGAVADSHGSALLSLNASSLPPSVSRRDSPPFIVQCIEASNRAREGAREGGREGGGGGGIEGEGVKVQRPSVGRTDGRTNAPYIILRSRGPSQWQGDTFKTCFGIPCHLCLGLSTC